MADLFKTLSSGLSRFVLGWLLPSLLTVGFFTWLVLPATGANVSAGSKEHAGDVFAASGVFLLSAVTLAVLFAYCSTPIFRFLEGYSMPPALARRLLRGQLRRWHRLEILTSLNVGTDAQRGLLYEQRSLYPEKREDVQATRLGNALRAMEGYGDSRYGLDNQTFWYELLSVADPRIRSDLEDTRAAVDFFVSLLSHCVLLAVVAASIGAAGNDHLTPILVAIASTAIAIGAYRGAVHNVLEWRYALQALLNTARPELARSMGFALPDTFAEEQAFWGYLHGLVTAGPHPDWLKRLDRRRIRYSRTPGG